MHQALYNLATRMLAPVLGLWLRFDRKHRVLRERFAPALPSLGASPIWVHACSVGEVNTAIPLLEELQKRFPDAPIVLSSSTVSGHTLARDRLDTPVVWCPFDHPRSVARFLETLRPRLLVLVETELWPNLLGACAARKVPVVVANGRLSDRHFPRCRRLARLLPGPFRSLAAVSAQCDLYAERYAALGIAADRIRVTGSTKFDSVVDSVNPAERSRLRRECGIPQEAPLLVFGSTRPGEEALAASCWRVLRDEIPGLRLVVAPRHVARVREVRSCFDEPVQRRSELGGTAPPEGARVLLVDTVGELTAFYSLATVAVVGGSFYPGVGGHNPLEPCALGVPTVFGPYMASFLEPVEILLAASGAIQVSEPGVLRNVLTRLLRNPVEGRQLGTRGRKAVLSHRGAIARNVDLIEATLVGASPSM